MFVTYTGDDEVIVTISANEKKTVEEYFTNGGRDLDDYNREVHDDCGLSIRSNIIDDCGLIIRSNIRVE